MSPCKSYIFLCVWLCLGLSAYAQELAEQLATQQQKLTYLHSQELGDMFALIHGKAYYTNYGFAYEHPYWLSEDWIVGSLQTTHYSYPEILLKYDAYFDALVFGADLIAQKYVWVNVDQVISFSIRDKTFAYLGRGEEAEAMATVNLIPGYFEVLYDGKTSLFAKREKNLQPINDIEKSAKFIEKNTRFLVRDGQFFTMRGKGDLFRFVGSQKEQILSYADDNDIRLRRITDAHLVQLIAYYDTL